MMVLGSIAAFFMAKFMLMMLLGVSMLIGWVAAGIYDHYFPNGGWGLAAFISGPAIFWSVVAVVHHSRERREREEEERRQQEALERQRLEAERQKRLEEERQRRELAEQQEREAELLRLKVEVAKQRQRELEKATPMVRWLREKTGL